MTEQIIYLNGQFMPLSKASVPVLDRGFIFGDGVYDVIPVFQRHTFRAAEHLARLFRSMAYIQIENPYSENEWFRIIDRLIAEEESLDHLVYLHVTRGVAPRSHPFPVQSTPTVFAMTYPSPAPSAQTRENGVACITIEDERWLHCNIKSTSLLGNVLASQRAKESGTAEAIQFRGDLLTEASSSNIWIVKDLALIGPRKNHLVLEGIRFSLFEEYCEQVGIPFSLRDISLDEVFGADEVLLSSAAKEVLSVVKIDGKTIGNGLPGPIYRKLYAQYQADKVRQGCISAENLSPNSTTY